MISTNELAALAGKTMHGEDGQKIGKIVDVYESTDGADGTFVTISTGLFGGHASFVPLARASMQGDDVVVPYSKDLVKDAPRVEADQELTSEEEDRLYAHYDLTPGATGTAATDVTTTTTAAGVGRRAADGHDEPGAGTDNAMTRSEERLQVGTQQVEAGRARLRKRIVTENVSQTVPVSHDEVTVTREPITAANMPQAMDGPALSEEEHEVVLRAEKAVVAKETVPVERVRLGVDTVTDEQTITESVRHEEIETETDVDATRDRTTR